MLHEQSAPALAIAVDVPSAGVVLSGDLTLPRDPAGVVVFVHGGGSGRFSPRNRGVAAALAGDGFATLLFDLLTRPEGIAERDTRHLRFDIALLSDRLVGAIDWVTRRPALGGLPVGLFGASTGAAAALVAATRVKVATVVSRGGRPDLAGAALPRVRCPTLFIIGGADTVVLELNRRAMAEMTAPIAMHIVPRAGHLFNEPGALAEVTHIAVGWFGDQLGLAADRAAVRT